MDSLQGMVVFAKVVEALSFSGAAKSLGLSKSAVSKQVSQLEERLGARLLNRTTRRLVLTEVGRVYYEHAARVLTEAEAAERAVSNLSEAPRGVLKLNVPMSFGFLHIAPALPEFLATAPELRVELALSDRYVDLMDEGFDLAVRIARDPLADSSLVARRLAPSRMVVCASPEYLAKHGEPRHPDDLKQHCCLGYTYAAMPDEWPFEVDGKPYTVKVRGPIRANNGDALHAAALNHAGLVVSPTFICGPDLQKGTLRAVLCDYAPWQSSIYAVYPSGRHLTPKVRAFIDFLARRFGPQPYWDWDTGVGNLPE